MTFADPDTLRRRLNRCIDGPFATIEVAHPESKSGIIVRVELIRALSGVEILLAETMELAASVPLNARRVNDPGWWAGLICATALEGHYPASIMRGAHRSCRHASLIVARGVMIEDWPEWPVVRLGLSKILLDLRGEAAMRLGPSDSDLLAYAEREGKSDEWGVVLLRNMFDQGVLAWGQSSEGVFVRAAR